MFPRQLVGSSNAGDPSTYDALEGVLPSQVGHYRIVKIIDQGGMGIVCLAEQREPIQRTVAVKFIKREIDTPFARKRMETECRSLAKFTHPNIARFIETGFCERIPFLVMEYVEQGKSILSFCQQPSKEADAKTPAAPLTLPERIELFLQACDALAHAHQRGVIHRDISSKNVLVTELDGKPTVKIIDFGIAVLGEPLGSRETMSSASRWFASNDESATLGTPAYMSPEQFTSPASSLDARTDIYSMGVLLFELTTGERPYEATTEQDARSAHDRFAKTGTVIAPSSKISERTAIMSKSGQLRDVRKLRRLQRELRGDLDAIVVKAMALTPDERFGSISELAKDLRAHLKGYPLEFARPATRLTVATKFFRRNWIGCTAVTVAVALLIFSVVISTRAAIERQRTNEKLLATLDERNASYNSLATSNRQLFAERSSAYTAETRGLPDLVSNSEIASARQILLGLATSSPSIAQLRGWEWHHMLARVDASEVVMGNCKAGFRKVMDTGASYCAIANDNSVWFWKAGTCDFIDSAQPHSTTIVAHWSGPAKLLTLDADGNMVSWNTKDGSRQEPVKLPWSALEPSRCAIAPDGNRVAALVANEDGKLRIEFAGIGGRTAGRVDSLECPGPADNALLKWHEDALTCLGHSEDDDSIWYQQWSGPRLEPTRSMQTLAIGDTRLGMPLDFSQSGAQFMLQYRWGAILGRWNQDTVEEDSVRVLGGPDSLSAACWSGDVKFVVTAGADNGFSLKAWDVDNDQYLGSAMLGHEDLVTDVAVTNDSQHILSASADGTIRKWALSTPSYGGALRPEVAGWRLGDASSSYVRFLTSDATGAHSTLLGVFSHYPWIALWNAETGDVAKQLGHKVNDVAEPPAFLGEAGEVVFASASRDGRSFALVRRHKNLGKLDLLVGSLDEFLMGKCQSIQTIEGNVEDMSVSDDGAWLALAIAPKGKAPGRVDVFKLDAGSIEKHATLPDVEGAFSCLTFDSKSRRLAAGGNRFIRIWTLESNQSEVIKLDEGEVVTLAFDPDGNRLAYSGFVQQDDGKQIVLLNVYEFKSQKTVRTVAASGESFLAYRMAWSPSGDNRIVTVDAGTNARVWLVDTICRLALTLPEGSGTLDSVAWSSDSSKISFSSPHSGAYLFHGAEDQRREVQFLCEELRHKFPLSTSIEKQWRTLAFPKRFDKDFELLLKQHGDDPALVTQFAWQQLASLDDVGSKSARAENAAGGKWDVLRKLVIKAAGQRPERAELVLLLGIIDQRCGDYKNALNNLKKFCNLHSEPQEALHAEKTLHADQTLLAKLHLTVALKQNKLNEQATAVWSEISQQVASLKSATGRLDPLMRNALTTAEAAMTSN